MCYVKSGKTPAEIAAAAAAAAASNGSASTDPFAFPELFNLGPDAFGALGEGLDKWNFGELLNGVVAADPTMIPNEFPLLDSNSFLTKWYGGDESSSAESADASPSFPLTQSSPMASAVLSSVGQISSPSYTTGSSSASPTLVDSSSGAMLRTTSTTPASANSGSGVNYFPQIASSSSDLSLAPFLQFAPVYNATGGDAPVYPSPPAVPVTTTPASSIDRHSSRNGSVSPLEAPKPIKRSHEHDDHHSGSDSSVDPLAAKRQKNTEAARRSRQRKVVQMETLQGQVTELQSENSKLHVRLAVVESEREQWHAKENELMERIRNLERQLNESHMAVVSLGLKKAAAPSVTA